MKSEIPTTNEYRVIIPPNYLGLGFKIKKSYVSEYLKS